MAATEPAARRRRRSPADARQEILDAAAALIAERPLQDVTVLAVMERTTLSRKSFYVYFKDRSELISALVRPLRADTDEAVADWEAADDPVAAGHAALLSAARTYRRHGAILRAVFWSAAEDAELAAVRAELVAPVVNAGTRSIMRAAPSIEAREARSMATALVTMNVHCLLSLRPDATDAELDALVHTLTTIWERAVLPHA